MWIVRLALRRPYTVAVGAILIFLLGALSIRSMIVDIFPNIDIPVVNVIWSYSGMSAEDIERRIVFISERSISTTTNGIAKIESQSMPGVGILRIYFEQGSDIGSAVAQISAISSTILRILPPGMSPPIIIPFNAANLPVVQMTLSSDTLSEEKIFDYALNFIRIKLFTIPGLAVPAPDGGRFRQINIDIDPARLSARGLSPVDVVNALQASDLILPAGLSRIGEQEYYITLNSTPASVEEFNQVPIKIVNNAPVTIGDVAKATDGSGDQTNIVRINGKRSAFLNILKKGDASTLDVVNSVKALLPELQANAPKGLDIKLDFDQSIFVKSAIQNVVLEALIATLLVSLMVLLFLSSWRSTIVVCTSIPLAILSSIVALKITGNTLNIMTLGGLSLAVGMLVDDATVEVENIHRNRNLGQPLVSAILTSAHQVALPAIMATLSICIVFFPVSLLTGPARFLFTPMALAVVFAMLASYILSRTLVPQLSRTLMGKEEVNHHNKFTQVFDKFQSAYENVLALFLSYRAFVLWVSLGLLAITCSLVFFIGFDFFPQTDTGLMKLHFRAPPGTRIERTEALVAQLEERIRQVIPASELETITSEVGAPFTYNIAFARTDSIASQDADVLIGLKEGHAASEIYMRALRKDLAAHFPGSTIYFQPADIVSQVLNFGLSAPIDIQFEGFNIEATYALAKKLKDEISLIPGIVDVNIKQDFNAPALDIRVDRTRAAEFGLTQRDVANAVLISLTGNGQVSPTYYLDPKNNVNYTVAAKLPLRAIQSLDDILATSVTAGAANTQPSTTSLSPTGAPSVLSQRLGNVATVSTSVVTNGIRHRNVQRLVNMSANVEGRDLGSAVKEVQQKIDALGALPPATSITIRGQNEVMNESFSKLGAGMILALLLVYLLMVVFFQSWLDPFIVLVAVPGAFVGILWMLALTGTTLNVESLMGSIMTIGIAASNSILLVSFANEARVNEGMTALEAALHAGRTRLRPVLMTALAMILGMAPAALALGEGGEQIAPLGRAVIGGLLVATIVTLFIVPIIYSLLRKELPVKHLLDERLEQEENQGVA
jgi:CzcA family heavy metal efflux pump